MTRLALLAVAAAVVGLGASAASAAEAATAIPAPAARLGAFDVCRIVAPTFEPDRQTVVAPEATRFQGGAKRFGLVAEPCLRPAAGFDI